VPTFGAAQNSDDIVLTLGGPSYAANTASANVTSTLTPVSIAQITLTKSGTNAYISYRAVIESQRPAVHNDIINVFLMGQIINPNEPTHAVQGMSVYTVNLPDGVTVTEGMNFNGALSSSSVLVFNVSETAKTGKHDFKIGLVINGIEFGTITCTLDIK
jgi:hypothetical protein